MGAGASLPYASSVAASKLKDVEDATDALERALLVATGAGLSAETILHGALARATKFAATKLNLGTAAINEALANEIVPGFKHKKQHKGCHSLLRRTPHAPRNDRIRISFEQEAAGLEFRA